MMANEKHDLEKIKLFITKLINEEQDKHSELLEMLKSRIDDTAEFDNTVRVLNKVHDARVEQLNKVYEKVRSL